MKPKTIRLRMLDLPRKVFLTLFTMLLVAAFTLPLAAQESESGSTLESVFESLPESAASEFAQPLVNAVGANLNTGWMTKAPDPDISNFDLRIGIVGMGAFIDGEEDIFQLLDVIFQFNERDAETLAKQSLGTGYDALSAAEQSALIDAITATEFTATITGPTIFGSEDDILQVTPDQKTVTAGGQSFTVGGETINVTDGDGNTITGLIDSGIFPTVAPQLSLGTVYGTQATIRYLPPISVADEVGDLKYFGFGIQHNPAVWFASELPVNFSISYFTQKVEIEEALEVTTDAYGLQVSKTFRSGTASFTPYVGYLRESSNMAVDYTFDFNGIPAQLQFDLEGENTDRFIVGTGLSLLGLNIFADYNFAEVSTFNFSLMYGF